MVRAAKRPRLTRARSNSLSNPKDATGPFPSMTVRSRTTLDSYRPKHAPASSIFALTAREDLHKRVGWIPENQLFLNPLLTDSHAALARFEPPVFDNSSEQFPAAHLE